MDAAATCTSPSRPMIRIRRSQRHHGGLLRPDAIPVVPYFWAPSWNSVRAVNKFQDEVGGSLARRRSGRPSHRARSGAAPHYFDQRAGSLRAARRRVAARSCCPRFSAARKAEPSGARRARMAPPALSRPERATMRRELGAIADAMSRVRDGRRSATACRSRLRPELAARRRGDRGSRGISQRCGLDRHHPSRAGRAMSHPNDIIAGRLNEEIIAGLLNIVLGLAFVLVGSPLADLDRAAAARLLPGPLRAEPRRSVRRPSGRRRHDQDPVQGGLDPALRGPRGVRAGARDRHGRGADRVRRDPDRARSSAWSAISISGCCSSSR